MSEPGRIPFESLSPADLQRVIGNNVRAQSYDETAQVLSQVLGATLLGGSLYGLGKHVARNVRKTPSVTLNVQPTDRLDLPTLPTPQPKKKTKKVARNLFLDVLDTAVSGVSGAINQVAPVITKTIDTGAGNIADSASRISKATLKGETATSPREWLFGNILPISAALTAGYGGLRLTQEMDRAALEAQQSRELEKVRKRLRQQMAADMAGTLEKTAADQALSPTESAIARTASPLASYLLMGNAITAAIAGKAMYDWKAKRTGRKLLEEAANRNRLENMRKQPPAIMILPSRHEPDELEAPTPIKV